MRKIKITYDITTPESAEIGDFEETGWENEEGVSIEPDEFDLEEYGGELEAVAALAAKVITSEGGVEPSDYPKCCPGHTWYTTVDPELNYGDGSSKRYSFHLYDFSPEEELAIYKLV